MDTQQLNFFLKVAELEHMSNAADELNISQPALSASIRKLEEELGTELFTREGRSIRLSKYGKLFLAYAKNAVDEYKKITQQLRTLRGEDEKQVRISMPPMFSFPKLLQSIYSTFPDASIVLKNCKMEDIFEQLKKGTLDFAILGAVIPNEIGLTVQTISNDKMVLLLPDTHPKAQLHSGRLIDFRDEHFINFSRPSSSSSIDTTDLEYYCELAGFNPRIVFQAPFMYEIVNAVKNGIGISLVPQVTLPQYNLDGISILEVNDPPCFTHLRMYYVKNNKERKIIKDIREHVINYFSEIKESVPPVKRVVRTGAVSPQH